MIVNYRDKEKNLVQWYGDHVLVKDCIDEIVAINGSCDDNIKIIVEWNYYEP